MATQICCLSTKHVFLILKSFMLLAGDGGADHVLVISGFSPMIKIKDLEYLVKPHSSQGVSICWVQTLLWLCFAIVLWVSTHFQRSIFTILEATYAYSACKYVGLHYLLIILLRSSARQALTGIHDPHFKLQRYSEGSVLVGQYMQNAYFLASLGTVYKSCCFV